MEESIDSGVRGILINRQQKTLLLDVIGKPTNKQENTMTDKKKSIKE